MSIKKFTKFFFTGKWENPPTKEQLRLLKKMDKKATSQQEASKIIEEELEKMTIEEKTLWQEQKFDRLNKSIQEKRGEKINTVRDKSNVKTTTNDREQS